MTLSLQIVLLRPYTIYLFFDKYIVYLFIQQPQSTYMDKIASIISQTHYGEL
jgi:hypothetical protein